MLEIIGVIICWGPKPSTRPPTSFRVMSSPPHLFDEEPQLSLQRLGAGSFATVYVVSGTRAAYKQTHGANEGGMLLNEYFALDKIYNMCNHDSFFSIPRALGFYDPSSNRSITHTASSTRRRRHPRPMIQPDSFTSFSSPVYAMDRIFHLPKAFAKNIAREFYPEQHQQQQPGPRLCRLYLGKVIGPSRFFNSENFPLDPVRYRRLQQLQELSTRGLSILEEVAYGMGEMLGRIHWRGGYDARDIEFVFGGDGYDGCSYNVIDFNQVGYHLVVLILLSSRYNIR